MNFEHTEERRMLADTLQRFIREQYDFATRDRIASSPAGYSATHWRQFAELGTLGALFNERHGGFGGSGFDIAVVFEQLGRGLVVEPFLGSAILAGGLVAELGTGAQHSLVDGLIDGSRMAAFAHFEPESRDELSRVRTHARPNARGWTLHGTKAVVQHAEAADFLVVSARTSGECTTRLEFLSSSLPPMRRD